MNDSQGNELQVGDLIAISGYGLDVGVFKSGSDNSSLHYYGLNDNGLRKASGLKGSAIMFINAAYPERILKITRDCLSGTNQEYYDKIMKIIKKDVATADNT